MIFKEEKPYTIVKDEEVEKTEILYEGEKEYLKEIHEAFPELETSEIYPSFDENYKFSFYFFVTDEELINQVNEKCDQKLPQNEENCGLNESSGKFTKYTSMIIGSFLVILTLLLVLFSYLFKNLF